MRLQRYSTGERMSIAPTDLVGSGGEARVFVHPLDVTLAAKVYHRPTHAQLQKLRVMLANPPDDPTSDQDHISIAWPIDLLSMAYGERQFAGYLMPRARGMRPLFKIYNPSSRRVECRLFTYRYLHRAARNLASAVRALHRRGYVVGDINESNILVSDRALVTLVDTDSFQVTDPQDGMVFRCPVGKAEYTPPELQGQRFSLVDRNPQNDLFGLAALIFQLLMEGTHPFAGLYQGADDPPPYDVRVASGHFPYGNRRGPYCPMPVSPPIEILHPTLRHLFTRCFEDGYRCPEVRPDAQTWLNALAEAESALTTCSENPLHLYGEHLSACPWCERSVLLGGRDPFPAASAVEELPPRRISASSLLPAASSSSVSMSASASSGGSVPAKPSSSPSASWQSSMPLAASVNGGLPGVVVSPTLFTFKLADSAWALGSLFWAAAAVAAVSLGIVGLSWLTALLALVCGAAGWKAGSRKGGTGRWMSAASALCACGAVILHPLAASPAAGQDILAVGGGGVRSLSFSPDGTRLAGGISRPEDSGLTEGEVKIWNVASRLLESIPERANGDIVSVAFGPDGNSVVAASDSPFGTGEVVLINASAKGAYRSVFKERRHMRQAAFSADGKRIASAGVEHLARVWNAETLEMEAALELPGDASALAFSADGSLLAVACKSPQGSVAPGYVTLWDVETRHLLWSHAAHGNGVQAVAFAPDGRTVVSVGNDGAVCLWDSRNGRLRWRQTARSYGIAAVAFAPKGSLLATAEILQTDQGTVNGIVLRDASTGAPLRTLSGSSDAIDALAFSPKNDLLASGSRDGAIRLWHVPVK